MKNRKMSTMVMTMALSVVMGVTALAAGTSGENADSVGDFTSNEATTNVKILGATDAESNLSATMPLMVTLAVKPNGAIVSPTGYKLTNTSQTMKIKVSHMQAEVKGDYVTTPTGGKKNIGTITVGNSKGATIKTLAQLASKTETESSDAEKWTLDSKETGEAGKTNEMTLRFSGNMKFSDASETAEDAFKVVYTIAKVN